MDIRSGEDKGIIDLDKTIEADRVVLTWIVKKQDLPRQGLLYAQLRAFSGDDEIWHSGINYFVVGESINATDYFPSPLPSEFEQMEQRVTQAKNETVEARGEAVQAVDDIGSIADHIDEVAGGVEETAIEVQGYAVQVESDRIRAEAAAEGAEGSENVAEQAMTDLLAMMGEDIATLTDGKLTPSQIPPLSINDVFEVESAEDMLALVAERGDVALVLLDDNIHDSYMLADDDPAQLANWKKLGVSYVANAGHAVTAENAENADKINNKRLVSMTESQYESAVKDPDTYYAVVPDEVI